MRRYLQQGGNLLLLTDPSSRESLQPLLQQLDIEALPGTLVDANVRRLGIDNPTVALVSEYPEFPATAGFDLLTLFPESLALQADQTRDWQVTGLLRTLPQSWNETGPIHGEVERNPELGEQAGPLTIGLALTRQRGEREQRVVVIGDGDFLSNSYLANAGNLDLGLALVGWLAGAEQLIGIPPRPILDRELQLSPLTKGIIGLGALFRHCRCYCSASVGYSAGDATGPEMRTLSRVNLILLLLVALLGGAAWWLQSSDMPPPLTRLSPARIQQIRLIRAGQTIELQRHNGVWWLGEARADQQRVAQLLGIATTPSLAHFPLPQGRLAAFGPAAT